MKIQNVKKLRTLSKEELKTYKSQSFIKRKMSVSSGYKRIIIATDADLD